MHEASVSCRYELAKVIEELKQLDADIIALQEVDIGCERSNSVDTGAGHQVLSQAGSHNCRLTSLASCDCCSVSEMLSPLVPRESHCKGAGNELCLPL